jgi:hypothetical protein
MRNGVSISSGYRLRSSDTLLARTAAVVSITVHSLMGPSERNNTRILAYFQLHNLGIPDAARRADPLTTINLLRELKYEFPFPSSPNPDLPPLGS